MKVVLVMFKDGQRREFALRGAKTILGRRRDCGLRIGTPDVSRQHCEVLVEPGNIRVKDLGSSNGTFVNGARVPEAALHAGDRLTVGPVEFIVQIDGKPPALAPEPAKPRDSSVAPSLADDEEETEEILDLGDFDEDQDPMSAIDDILDLDEEDEDKKK